MGGKGWKFRLGIGLVVASAIVYLAHFFIFRDPHHIFIYMIGDIAFVPLEVLIVTLIIHHLLSEREKRLRLEKLNMVIGAFFSEIGHKLLAFFSDHDPHLDDIRGKLLVSDKWTDEDFDRVIGELRVYRYGVEIKRMDFSRLKDMLLEKRGFLLRLLENPNLLEHESFTDLLMAVFHLMEELEQREKIAQLPEADLEHLTGDVKRVYQQIVDEWLRYMEHLKLSYPYLFSLALRTNPFDTDCCPTID